MRVSGQHMEFRFTLPVIHDPPLQDVCDGEGIEKHVDTDPRFVKDQRCPMLMLVTDPFQIFKDDDKSSTGPVLLVNMNVPPHLRYRLGLGCHFLCFDMGDAYKEEGLVRDASDSLLQLVVDELNYLDRVGFTVEDSSRKDERVQLHAKLLLVLSDLRGLQSLLKCGGTPSKCGCLKCWFASIGKADRIGKTIYNGHYVLLPQGHPLRAPLSELHSIPKRERNQNERSDLRHRSHEEVMARLKEPDAELGPLGEGFPGERIDMDNVHKPPGINDLFIAGLSRDDLPADQTILPPKDGTSLRLTNPLAQLRGFDAVTQIILDSMHTIGGVLKGCLCLLQSLRENKHVHQYEADFNNRRFDRVHLASKLRTSTCIPVTRKSNPLLSPSGQLDLQRMRLQLEKMAEVLPKDQAGARFTRLFTAAKKSRMHHMFVLAGIAWRTSQQYFSFSHTGTHPSTFA